MMDMYMDRNKTLGGRNVECYKKIYRGGDETILS